MDKGIHASILSMCMCHWTAQETDCKLAQPEQHQDWCASLTKMLTSMPPKRAPCNCKPPQPKEPEQKLITVVDIEKIVKFKEMNA